MAEAKDTQVKKQDIVLKKVYVEGGRRLPAWFFPLVSSLILLFVILWLLPKVFAPELAEPPAEEVTVPEIPARALQVGDNAVSRFGELPLYDSPEPSRQRVSSALFGESMTIVAINERSDFFEVQLADGFTGWCKAKDLAIDAPTKNHQGIRAEAQVLNPYKQVMSHTVDGYPLLTAPMGTILPVDYLAEQVLRVRLPGDQVGWVSRSGLQILDADNMNLPQGEGAALFATSAMNFYRTPFVPGGMSKQGADMAGVIFIAARVNGLDLPRDLTSQAQAGEEVELILDVETGLARPNMMQSGDVLFFHTEGDPETIGQAALIIEEGQALTNLVNDSIISIRDLNHSPELMRRLVTARRYFSP